MLEEEGGKNSETIVLPDEEPSAPVLKPSSLEDGLASLYRELSEMRASADARMRQVSYERAAILRALEGFAEPIGAERAAELERIVREEQRARREMTGVMAAVETEASYLRAEERADQGGIPVDAFLRSFERQFAERGVFLPVDSRDKACASLREMRRLLREGGETLDEMSRESLRHHEFILRDAEVRIDGSVAEQWIVPTFFQWADPRALAAALRGGMEHPRYLTQVLARQREDMGTGETVSSPADVIRASVPEELRGYVDALVGPDVPEELRASAKRIFNQLRNRYFAEAADAVLSLEDRADGEWASRLAGLEGALREEAERDRGRFQEMRRHQEALYEAITRSHPERAAEMDRRRALEDVLMNGEIVGDIRPLLPNVPHAGAPHLVTLRHGDQTVVAVVKFGFAERFVRPGVEPGLGHWREVAGAAHALGMGVDAPAVVARDLEGYGPVTVMEMLDGRSCNLEHNWFVGRDGAVRTDLDRIAIDDYLQLRADGAPRNIVLTSEGRLVPIDRGSDLPAEERAPVSSVALYVASEGRRQVPADVQKAVVAWEMSEERQIFEDMLTVFPQDMESYVDAYQQRLRSLILLFRDVRGAAKFPRYGGYIDFGERFFRDWTGTSRVTQKPSSVEATSAMAKRL